MSRNGPFADLPPGPLEHFKLHLFAAIATILDRAGSTFGSEAASLERFPFLAGYRDEIAAHGMGGVPAGDLASTWHRAIAAWEASATAHLPIRALQAEGLDEVSISILMTIGIVEEDARFGLVLEEA